MRDGLTRKLSARERDDGFETFLAEFRASIVVVEGPASGMEYEVESPRVSLGRGPGVDLAFPDPSMSKVHAEVEWSAGRLRLRDLGSMNGVRVNGAAAQVADLKHGDRFALGEHVFRLVLEQRQREPRTYVLPDDD
jgi:pSer/pThr/pTyr-binding forkhead associated (FHA) protein